ncbi:transcription-repair coupling factor [Formicincola oecophyllae]|uniref:Transcription-repair-coupling factor n=1 Tax=Formicincola oecophyllae TaxID=2558361 RepID=A0A4Y6UEL2_9PROT|nr:transcription-repair coupling factor [Formicincola oecophyllae]
MRQRLAEHQGTLVHVARNAQELATLAEQLEWLMPEVDIVRFPAWDSLPYDRVSPHGTILAERAAALSRLLEPAPPTGRIVLTTVNALIQRTSPVEAVQGRSLQLKPGGALDQATVAGTLAALGYSRVDTVMERGEYAIRGGIMDLFPPALSQGVRLDLFGDEIENIRTFDIATQRSGAPLGGITLGPATEAPLTPETIRRFGRGWLDAFGPDATGDAIPTQVAAGRSAAGMEHYLPLFHEGDGQHLSTLLDYVPGAALTLHPDVAPMVAARLEMVQDHYQARLTERPEGELPYRPLPPSRLYLDQAGWEAMLARHPSAVLQPFAPPAEEGQGADGALVDAGFRPAPRFVLGRVVQKERGTGPENQAEGFAAMKAQVAEWQKSGRKVCITAWSRGSKERLLAMLAEHGIKAKGADSWPEAAAMARGTVAVVVLGLEHGFVGPRQVFITEQDILGERLARPPRKKRKNAEALLQVGEIEAGDLVVHEEYGIGRYAGLETVSEGLVAHDYLAIVYEGEQRLLLPVENIDLLSRFGADQGVVALDRLGGTAWQARKAKMKTRLREMAADLIRTAALRALKTAPAMAPAEGAWDEFCARFPFIETEDQLQAVSDVLGDMASGVPMDRLICGDVGFGKTEVALRAAFVAAMSGRQVAVVVPTTLLARQHFNSFVERFKGFPLKVAQLSRLVTPREAARVRQGLADGTIDVVIGTHALLGKGIAPDRLGLVIVDEEQHFGVAHKERLKALREDVHVLTLSATPLPRTLQLSLTGVREMSLIATPPTDRLAVRTFITPFDRMTIKEAIQRERFRGGQVFCVVPRLADMPRMAERLKAIAPDARIAEAHGRLTPTELETVMSEFSEGKYDILLSTNIVESGLDMPGVNTIIIHRADMFGLGQLYQLRGRVGRGKQRGYAYLTWPQGQALSTSSRKRLEIMETLDTLGAGFTLASHDLDLRGAGNLLGDEQSGHIREVGVELYQQMLQEAVVDLRAQRGKEAALAARDDWTPAIVLGLPVLLPEGYIKDLPVRLNLYRRIARLADEGEVEAMSLELADRFGPLPEEVSNLLETVMLKKLCREVGVERLETGPKGMVLQFRKDVFANPDGLLRWVERNSKAGVKIRPDGKLAVVRELPNAARIKTARKVLGVLGKLMAKASAPEPSSEPGGAA